MHTYNKNTEAFGNEAAMETKRKIEEAKEVAKKAERAALKLALEAEISGDGFFSLKPKITNAYDIPQNTNVRKGEDEGEQGRGCEKRVCIENILVKENKEGLLNVVINNQHYIVKLSELKTDQAAVDAIEKKLKSFSSFPGEESVHPKKPWDLGMPLKAVLDGAATMNDVYSLKQVAGCGPAKKPSEWKTEHGVSRNFSYNEVTPKFQTYRQSRECDSVACAIVLLEAGAKITEKVKETVAKDSFFAKGIPRTRMLRVLETFEKGLKINWEKHWATLDDLEAPWPPAEEGENGDKPEDVGGEETQPSEQDKKDENEKNPEHVGEEKAKLSKDDKEGSSPVKSDQKKAVQGDTSLPTSSSPPKEELTILGLNPSQTVLVQEYVRALKADKGDEFIEWRLKYEEYKDRLALAQWEVGELKQRLSSESGSHNKGGINELAVDTTALEEEEMPSSSGTDAMLKATIPEGVVEGQTFVAKYKGSNVYLVVPKGKKSGEDLILGAPVEAAEVVSLVEVNAKPSMSNNETKENSTKEDSTKESSTKESTTKQSRAKEGYLEKTGYFNKAFKRRFFRLSEDGTFQYFEDEKSDKASGKIDLSVSVINTAPYEGGVNYFIMEFGKMRTRQMRIKAGTREELADWIEALKSHKRRGGLTRTEQNEEGKDRLRNVKCNFGIIGASSQDYDYGRVKTLHRRMANDQISYSSGLSEIKKNLR
eukprot:jgi/Bigna1/91080/estExt_fgenesh1_pg.C_880010